jgi:hypothetical protein
MEAVQPSPVTLQVDYPQELSRWLIFVKWLLAIPHYIVVYLLLVVVSVITFIAFFIILFTKEYPRELFNFTVGAYRWQANVFAYAGLMRDEYPPFSWDPGVYPVAFDIEYPQELSRWLIFVKWLLVIPQIIVVLVLFIVQAFVQVIAFFAILFTKKYPKALFDFSVGVFRYSMRINAYTNFLRDEYPPFDLKP